MTLRFSGSCVIHRGHKNMKTKNLLLISAVILATVFPFQAQIPQEDSDFNKAKSIVAEMNSLPITFVKGETELTAAAQSNVKKIAKLFRMMPKSVIIQINVHVSEINEKTGNSLLSKSEAENLSNYRAVSIGASLVTPGFDINSMVLWGTYGSKYPVAANDTAEGRAKNARVEFLLSPESFNGDYADVLTNSNSPKAAEQTSENVEPMKEISNSSQTTNQSAQVAAKPDIKELFLAIDRKDMAEFNRLIAAGVDLKATHGEAKPTALHQAAVTGTTEMIKILLGKIYINERDANSRTPLFYAVAGKNLVNLKFLVRAGADMEQKDSGGSAFDEYADDAQISQYIAAAKADTARMWQALKANDAATALQLMTSGNASPNAVFEKQTPLVFAAAKGDQLLFDKILNAGGEVSTFVAALFPPHRTALDAAAENGSIDMVKKILARDLGWRKEDIIGNALAAAIRGKRDGIIPLLLAAGVNVNKGFDLNTPISEAARRGDAGLLKNLIAKGATKETLGASLYTAFDAPNSQAIFQTLLDAGADVNYSLLDVSALTRAAEEGNILILKLLTDKGAAQNNIQNAFVVAAEKNQVNAMRFLISLPAKPNLNGIRASLGGGTALTEAAKNNAFEAVRFLVARGAEINFVADLGLASDTALTAAVRKNNAPMVNYLLQLGANPKIAMEGGLMSNAKKTALDFAANKPEILKLLQNPPSATQIAKNVQFIKLMMSGSDFAAAEKYAEAIAEYNRALEIYPDSTGIYLRQIQTQLAMKNFDQAAATAQKIIDVCPKQKCDHTTQAEAHNYRAVALIRQQKFADAQPDAEKALEFCTKGEKPCGWLSSIYNNRGVIFREKRMLPEAVADLTKSIELAPNTARAYFHRAKTYLLIGDRAKAEADLSKAKQLDPRDEEIKNFVLPAAKANGK